MQQIFEPIFHVLYLSTVITLGVLMVKGSRGSKYFKYFGVMAILLGFGDAFHLVPRVYALLTAGLENYPEALGFGRFMTSITMTIFYLLLYHIWKMKFDLRGLKKLDVTLYGLAALRIVLLLFPQNQWLSANPPVIWGIYRNIPFAVMGIIMIYLLYTWGKKQENPQYKKMALGVFLSFAFYIPVVLWGQQNFLVGMLMIPKTMAYLWIVFLGYFEMRQEK